jgi:beta-glucosidase-like glycosyl hydrolase
VNDLRQLCDRRATEINTLAYQMQGFAMHLVANGEDADPNVKAILKAIDSGEITVARIDDSVARILALKIESGIIQ